MNPMTVRDRLQELPPDLPGSAGRFEQVRARVRRRRRRQVVVGVAAAVALFAGVPAGVHLVAADGGSDRGVGPAGSSRPMLTAEPMPGGVRDTVLSDPRTHDGAGTETVKLGARPAGASAVSVELTCLTPGRVEWPDGASIVCEPADVGSTGRYVVALDRGQEEIVVTAGPGVRWRAITTYVSGEETEWGVNGNGDTYGVATERGYPDLIRVAATNGTVGYVYYADLDRATGGDVRTPEEALAWQEAHAGETVSLQVYESDGETVVGEFTVGGGTGTRDQPEY